MSVNVVVPEVGESIVDHIAALLAATAVTAALATIAYRSMRA